MDKPRLWTKNFTTITLGSAVSILGNAVSAYAMSLVTLEETKSVFLYALLLAANNLPKIILPLMAGTYLDKWSRRKMVYTLDFISAGLFLLLFALTSSGYFNYAFFLSASILIGAIDSVYAVAYDSFFPLLVKEGNFSKAYSVSSLLYPIALMMTPVATLVYKHFGLPPLFAFNAASFLLAAIFETTIRVHEPQISGTAERTGLRDFLADMRRGFQYIRAEKGLLVITVYFFICTMTSIGMDTLWIPYFNSAPALGLMAYSYATSVNVAGRLTGGAVQYRIKYPADKKFAIAMAVYVISCFINGSVLFMPYIIMLVMFFLDGFLSVTSFNIRLSTTQSYVPEEYRGRFNGVFQMACNAGMIIGQLIAGALAESLPCRAIIIGLMAVNLIATYTVMYRGRRHVATIYNRDV
ncbi:MAG: MFS transporter [Oscillospiraceae bacterium]|nr:MFS transporter [Oscillospiraceae bacterium]